MKVFILRYAILVILFITTMLLPWWLVMIFIAVAAFLLDNFFEVILIGIYYDYLFHIPAAKWYLSIINTGIIFFIYTVMLGIQKITQKPKMITL